MRKSIPLILLVCLIVAFICHMTLNQSVKDKASGEKNDAEPNSRVATSNTETVLENNALSGDDIEAIDIEIEQHGYHPSSEQERENLRQSYRIARDGAAAKITFHVTDSEGRNVSNASIRVGFVVTDVKRTHREGSTDENGIFIAEGKTAYEVGCAIEKNGYYNTFVAYNLNQQRGNNVTNGKWQPWNPTIKITLKEKRNPIPMYVRYIDCKIPKKELIEFDCEKGDWVQPHGEGEIGDFAIYYESSVLDWNTDWMNHVNKLIFSSKEGGGFVEKKKDTYSFAKMVYDAPMTGYSPEIILSLARKDGKAVNEITISKDHYLVFRSRVKKDEDGKIIHSRFGKITEFEYGESRNKKGHGYIRFVYYFNPNDNDRNLEYDCVNNLINPRERINAP